MVAVVPTATVTTRNAALDNAVSRLSTIAQNEGIAFLQLPKAERVAINQQQYQRLPDMTTAGNQASDYQQKIEQAVKNLGINLTPTTNPQVLGQAGLVDGNKTIYVNPSKIAERTNPEFTNLRILSHELGHVVAGHDDKLPVPVREVEAETISNAVLNRMLGDTGNDLTSNNQISGRYVQNYAQQMGKPITEVYQDNTSQNRINTALNKILDAIPLSIKQIDTPYTDPRTLSYGDLDRMQVARDKGQWDDWGAGWQGAQPADDYTPLTKRFGNGNVINVMPQLVALNSSALLTTGNQSTMLGEGGNTN